MNIFCQAESNLPRNGDMAVRNAATMRWELAYIKNTFKGAFWYNSARSMPASFGGGGKSAYPPTFDASRRVPAAPENRPRAGMLLGCVCVGR